MKENVVIVAPHADDEIIGCFTVLKENKGETLVLFNDERAISEALVSSRKFGFKRVLLKDWKKLIDKGKQWVFFFPNPYTEYHPLHKQIGEYGLFFSRTGLNVNFYSTNMNTDNLIEIPDSEEKKKALNECYPNKSDLWKFDWRYFLFEGYTNYNPLNIVNPTKFIQL